MSKSVPVQSYVDAEQRERWREKAEGMGLTESQFVAEMVSAGIKKFDRAVEPDVSRDELRQQRNELYSELREAREEIHRLEEKLMESEREVIIDFVEDNQGCSYADISNHLAKTAPTRATVVLSEIEGTDLRVDEDGGWYVR